jgi:hypothetical protein
LEKKIPSFFLCAELCSGQGDQTVRIFTFWSIVYFEQLFGRLLSIPNLCATIPHGNGYALLLTKHGSGYTLGDFFHKLIWSPCFRPTWLMRHPVSGPCGFCITLFLTHVAFVSPCFRPTWLLHHPVSGQSGFCVTLFPAQVAFA